MICSKARLLPAHTGKIWFWKMPSARSHTNIPTNEKRHRDRQESMLQVDFPHFPVFMSRGTMAQPRKAMKSRSCVTWIMSWGTGCMSHVHGSLAFDSVLDASRLHHDRGGREHAVCNAREAIVPGKTGSPRQARFLTSRALAHLCPAPGRLAGIVQHLPNLLGNSEGGMLRCCIRWVSWS